MPGMANMKTLSVDENLMKRVEALTLSMTLPQRKPGR
jgi:hypothetical protein